MQKLHLVGFTTDQKSLILSARRGSRSGGFQIEVDAELAAAVEAARTRATEAGPHEDAAELEPMPPPRPQSSLSVRELQSRLRAGRSIQAVAAEAGVDADWVARFAPPVLAEQARVIDDTRAAVLSRPRLGPSALPLGAAVYRNLVAKGVSASAEELDRGWSSRQVADGHWLVTFVYTSRGRRQQAVWDVDLRAGQVRAHDRLAAQLGHVPGPAAPAAPASASLSPSRPARAPTGPTDADRIASRRVAEARKQAEAQLADAAKRSSKRSAAAARRAAGPKKGAAPARTATPAVDPPVDPVAAELVEAQPTTVPDPAVVTEPPPAPAAVAAPTPRPTEPEMHADPAVRAVAAVREAAAALLQDFASGALSEEPPTPSRLVNRPALAPAAAPPAPEPEPAPAVDVAATSAPAVDVEPESPEPEPAPAVDVEPEPPEPESPEPESAPPPAAPAPPPVVEEVRARPRFRDDLAAPAGNGSQPRPGGEAPSSVSPRAPTAPRARPRRTTPLRAR